MEAARGIWREEWRKKGWDNKDKAVAHYKKFISTIRSAACQQNLIWIYIQRKCLVLHNEYLIMHGSGNFTGVIKSSLLFIAPK